MDIFKEKDMLQSVLAGNIIKKDHKLKLCMSSFEFLMDKTKCLHPCVIDEQDQKRFKVPTIFNSTHYMTTTLAQ